MFADTPFESRRGESMYIRHINLKNDLVKSLKLSFNQDNVPSNSFFAIQSYSSVHVTESNRDRKTKKIQPANTTSPQKCFLTFSFNNKCI